MTERLDHDRLFKELLSTFFVEFIELFFPQVAAYWEPNSVTLLNTELFTDVTAGDRYETDLLAQVQFQGKSSYFLVHIETQSTPDTEFGKRMFRYFSRLYEKFDLPVYPIVVFSYDRPKKLAGSKHQIKFPDLEVLQFNYRVIQLNRLNWRDYLNQPNPIASALMAKMEISPGDRPKVKAQCLRLLVTLRLDRARIQLISGFIDSYLRLNEAEQKVFETEIETIEPQRQEGIMEIVTSWMEQGIEQGIEQGMEQGIEQGMEQGIEQAQRKAIARMIQRQFTLEDMADILGMEIEKVEEVANSISVNQQ